MKFLKYYEKGYMLTNHYKFLNNMLPKLVFFRRLDNYSTKIKYSTSVVDNENILKKNENKYLNFEKRIMESMRVRNIKYFRWTAIIIFFSFLIIIISGRHIKKYFGKQSADIAVIALQDKDVHNKADNIAKEILTSILTDQDTMEKTKQFVIRLCNDEYIKNQLILLVVYSLSTKEVNDATKQLVISIVNNPYILEQVTLLVLSVMSDQRVTHKLNNELTYISQSIINNTELHKQIKLVLNDLLEDKNLNEKSVKQLKNILFRIITFGYYDKN